MNELKARRIYLNSVRNTQNTSRKFLDRRRTRANREEAFFLSAGLSHVQKIFYTEWMTHFSTAELSKVGITKLAKTFSELT